MTVKRKQKLCINIKRSLSNSNLQIVISRAGVSTGSTGSIEPVDFFKIHYFTFNSGGKWILRVIKNDIFADLNLSNFSHETAL